MALVLATAACGPLPQPFGREQGQAADTLLEIEDIPGVYVVAVEGTTAPMGRLLAEAAADALNDKDVPAYVNPPKIRRFVLEGRVEFEPGGVPRAVHWQLLDSGNSVVGEHAQPIPGPPWRWDYGDPKLLHEIGLGVARRFAAIAAPDEPNRPVQAATAFPIYFAAVEGAPGDGNQSLQRALRTALTLEGVDLAESAERASAVLSGNVDVGKASNGMQPVRIVWALTDTSGTRIGEATQANAVPAGRLDGPWREVAGFAAKAAVDGILSLIESARNKSGPARKNDDTSGFRTAGQDLELPPPHPSSGGGESESP